MNEYDEIDSNVFTLSGVLSAPECAQWIALAEAQGFTDAPLQTTAGAQIRRDVRNNQRVMIDDDVRAGLIWNRIRPYVPAVRRGQHAVGLNERWRFYRYDVGQQFEWHYDGAFERPNGERSQITVLIYLNDGFEGGETSFGDTHVVHGRYVKVTPRTGLALFFDHPLRHKGEPVVAGRKYVVRTDVMYGPAR